MHYSYFYTTTYIVIIIIVIIIIFVFIVVFIFINITFIIIICAIITMFNTILASSPLLKLQLLIYYSFIILIYLFIY